MFRAYFAVILILSPLAAFSAPKICVRALTQSGTFEYALETASSHSALFNALSARLALLRKADPAVEEMASLIDGEAKLMNTFISKLRSWRAKLSLEEAMTRLDFAERVFNMLRDFSWNFLLSAANSPGSFVRVDANLGQALWDGALRPEFNLVHQLAGFGGRTGMSPEVARRVARLLVNDIGKGRYGIPDCDVSLEGGWIVIRPGEN
jgi:hypothetical protein